MRHRMIQFFIGTLLLGLTTAASAENSLKQGAKALSFGIVDSDIEISGRLFVSPDVAALAGIGLAHSRNDENTTDFSLSAGVRKYLAKSDLAPFVGGTVSLRRNEVVVPTITGTSIEADRVLAINGVLGAEYFFAKMVSAEAQIGVGISDASNGADETTLGTFRSGVTVNIYFP